MKHDQGSDEPNRQRYHHGDLRRDLLRIARKEIAGHGAQAVSLSSLARLAGVSQPAPYRHFADREALLEAVAADGFEEFALILAEAMADRSPIQVLKAIAVAYVTFAEANIEVYRLMFATPMTAQAKSESSLGNASGKAFELLRSAVAAISSPADVEEEAYLVWAQLHGLVMLKADGFIARPLAEFIDQPGLLERFQP